MKIVVTGGGGFLGQALCRGLVARGHEVISYNRGHYPELQALGVAQVRGDLTDAQALHHAVAGAEAVFHNAAKAGAWGSYDSYYQPNVAGTENVVVIVRVAPAGTAPNTQGNAVVQSPAFDTNVRLGSAMPCRTSPAHSSHTSGSSSTTSIGWSGSTARCSGWCSAIAASTSASTWRS
jgi:NAD(P)-dependent dehydrogenase (short-subunit alcohol dehydrogenase family)